MRYLKNIKSFFSKNKSIVEVLYKKISLAESTSYKENHFRSNFSLEEINEFKNRKFVRITFYHESDQKDLSGLHPFEIVIVINDGGNCNKISTSNYDITKFNDEWYIFEIFNDFDDYGEYFLCDTWDGVKQLLNRNRK